LLCVYYYGDVKVNDFELSSTLQCSFKYSTSMPFYSPTAGRGGVTGHLH
jgi:hypothetical protein